ncbi:uncharacterized protein LOC103361685 isoform X1 [Stegastes partitus]|uniref:Uncharacterized protein LOC103361685 isoform X1 n=1 Tax=Stegastes partitus TaxID=144197 RepID=A0A9Y4K3R5_9TELE|nr:PREDICTED: uncharacterized protein LOC103361685 isoform X1 [Stegastes partitus]
MLESKPSAAGATFRAQQLICQLYDPHYVVEVRSAEVFDTSTEFVPLDSDAVETGMPVSPESDLEESLGFIQAESCIQNRPGSADSVPSEIEMRPLSPESPMEYRPISPESLILLARIRTSSPDSTTSINEFRALSPDSPLPQFIQMIEPAVLVSGSRSSSPTSVKSDTELEVLDMPFIEVKGRSFTPDSENEFRTLSPDSPIPEFRQLVFYPPTVLTAECRSTSPESVCVSDVEYEDGLFASVSDEQRPQSPDSLAGNENQRRALSPDSPVPQFIAREVERFPSFVGFKSAVPESAASVVKYAPLIKSSLDTEARPDTPKSLEPEFEERPLSPDSESEYTSSSPASLTLMSNFRSSSPESNGSPNEFRALSPDSPIPDLRQVLQESINTYMEHRSSSPESASSDLEADMKCTMMLFEDRPSSPDSLASAGTHTRLSPDSPVPEFRLSFPVPYVAASGYRSSSPESSASDWEFVPFISQLFEVEERPLSPQSICSLDDYQRLSPDSPIPQYTHIEPGTLTVTHRSTSPESVYSDEEFETDLCIPWLFEDRPESPDSAANKYMFRPLSPDSPIPQFTQALQESFISHMNSRSSSPESEASEIEYAPLISQIVDFEDRAESRQSGVSDSDLRCLSPDSPLPEYTVNAPTGFDIRYRSTSPQSVYSDEDLETDLCIPWLFEDRAESPDSTGSKHKFRPLSPDSPVPQFTQALQESSMSCVTLRSSSPESGLSDLEIELSSPVVTEDRPSSPESLSSLSQYRFSPDSPVPDFRRALLESFVEFSASRLSSPDSEASEIEYAPLISQIFYFEERTESRQSWVSDSDLRCLSPDSPLPEYSRNAATMLDMRYRSTSPESVFSDEDLETDLCIPWLFEDRPESPDSIVFKDVFQPLSPDSPIPQFTQALQESFISHMNSRSSSPESEASEIEYAPLISKIFDFEDRAESCQSGMSDSDLRCLSPDSPLPEYTVNAPTGFDIRYRSTSPQSVYSDEDLETDLCIPWLFEDRAESPDSIASKDTFRPLSPDSPIPQFTQELHESFMSHMKSRSSSPESVLSDLEMELSFLLVTEGRPSSPESLTSVCQYRRLSPDSPIPDFRQVLPETYVEFSASRLSSPDSEASDVEYAPLITQTFYFEERTESRQSGVSDSDLRCLSPDSPLPEYTMNAPTMLDVRYRSTSPESVYSDEELETDLCIPWLFEDRAESPDSIASDYEFRPLSPDSPIPEFTQHESTISHINLRSTSPESVFSDFEMDLASPIFLESRPSSTESLASIGLSPDSPLPDFVQPMFELHENISGYRSASPESTCSDVEYFVISLGSLGYDKRHSSPGSEASGDEYQALSPDSPVPEYRPRVPERVIVNVGYRSSSPESIESDVEYALSEFLMSMRFGGEDRPDSPESVESEIQERPLSVESIPEYKPMSPLELMLLRNIGSVSPDSTQSLDEHKRLSPDSPLPWFTQNVLEAAPAQAHYGTLSPELSDEECDLAFSDSFVTDKRTLSPQSERSNDEALTPDSPIPDFTKTFVENVTTLGNISPAEFSDSDDLSQNSVPFCPEERSASPESVESDMIDTLESKSLLSKFKASVTTDATTDSNVSTTMEPFSSDEAAVMVAEYNLVYDAELWKLISQVHDPQYAGETFTSKTGFMQFIGSTIEYENKEQNDTVKDNNEEDATAKLPHSEVTHQFTATDTENAHAISDIPIAQSPPPMIEHSLSSGAAPYRETKYTFEIPEAQIESDDDWVIISDIEDDGLCYSPESLIDYRPMSPNSFMAVQARASSPESVISVNEFRPLSPDSPLPEFTEALPECVTFLRSTSSSPETLASYIEYMPWYLESDFIECRLPSPESALSQHQNMKNRPLSSESLPEYRPMSTESAMRMTDKRASSPESMPEFNENRSLSPDSPIPQFTASLDEYTTMRWSSSPESLDSDSECELMVTSWRAADMDRPSSPESISSVNEFRQLLPDSPVPEFMRILSSYFMDGALVERSSSPVSLSSDSEFVALPIDCWIDDSPRPLSPESVESEKEFCCDSPNSELFSPAGSPLFSDQSLPNRRPMSISPILIQTSEKRLYCPDWQIVKASQSDVVSYKEWMQHGSESFSALEDTAREEDFREDLSVTPVTDVHRKEEKTLDISAGEVKSKTASQWAPNKAPGETHFQTDDEIQRQMLSTTTTAQDDSKIGVPFSDDKQKTLVPLRLPDQNSYTTHRSVTPFLPTHERTSCVVSDSELSPREAQSSELFSPMSTQFLVPPDYEAVFSGHQTLRVSECSQVSTSDLSPVSPVFSESISAQVQAAAKRGSETEDFEFSPDFKRVLSEFEHTVSEFQSGESKLEKYSEGFESPQHSDSDLEFYDCRQALSDFSEPDDVKLEHEITYHISEPPSPIPGSTPAVSFLKGSPQYTGQPFLGVEDYKRFSSGSESLGEFAYDSEASRGCQTESGLPICEELPSRDQGGYYDDDDFLGREIAEELGMLSSDSSEEEVLTTRVVRRRVIIQADNLPDIPPQTVTEEKYTDEHGNMVVKKKPDA